jgi:hypothetical protein
MKAKHIFSITTLLILPILIIISACSIGVCTLKFEAWGGTHPNDIILSPGESLDSKKFTDASKQGFKFINWCYDSNLTQEISFPMVASNGTFTYYAKYELDNDYYTTNNTNVTWNNNESITADFECNSYTSISVLIDKTNTNFELNKVTITPVDEIPGQGFYCHSLDAYDENGKTISDSNDESYIFQPETKLEATTQYKFVLKITAGVRGGAFRITIN